MKTLFLLNLLFAFAASCQSSKVQKVEFSCIERYIDSNKNNEDWLVGSVEEYEFQGKLVYAFGPSEKLADGTTLIKTSECKDLCTVGGFRGSYNSMCNGANFFEKAVLKRKIWSENLKNN